MTLSEAELTTELVYLETGQINWTTIHAMFQEIEDELNLIIDEVSDQSELAKYFAERRTFSVSKICEYPGDHTLLNAGKHGRCKIISAHCVVHDNIAEEINIELVGRSHKAKFSDTEKKGSAKELEILTNGSLLHWNDALKVNLSTLRRVTVYVTFESTDEVV